MTLPNKVYRVGDSPTATTVRPTPGLGLQMGGFGSKFWDRYENGENPDWVDKNVEVTLAESATILVTLTATVQGGSDAFALDYVNLRVGVANKSLTAQEWTPPTQDSAPKRTAITLYGVTTLPAGTHTFNVKVTAPGAGEPDNPATLLHPYYFDAWFSYIVFNDSGGEDFTENFTPGVG